MSSITIPKITLSLSAFDIARYGKDELYNMVEEKYASEHFLNLSIEKMELLPFKIVEDEVLYEVKLISFKKEY